MVIGPLAGIATGTADGTVITSDTFHYAEELRCAIDPNDKQVAPSRPDSTNGNYTQFDETLRYTVRFQNTGNDTAFTVRIEDELAPELDLSTFRPLTASHPYTVSIEEDRRAVFTFKDILLPDSTTNLLLSQGFVTFEINTLPGLEDFTAVKNTAGIFFDFNQPVITNTVSSSMVEFLDEDQDGYLFFQECDDENFDINPAAEEIAGNGIDEDCDGEDRPVSVNEVLSGKLEVFPNPVSEMLQIRYSTLGRLDLSLLTITGVPLWKGQMRSTEAVDVSRYPSGVYLLRVKEVQTGTEEIVRIILR